MSTATDRPLTSVARAFGAGHPPECRGNAPVWRQGTLWLLLAIGVAGSICAWARREAIVDDAYIYFRYADNVVAGRGAVFNVGERVEGCFSPLWLLLLVGGRLIGLSARDVALGLGMVAHALLPAATYHAARGGGGSRMS